MPATDLQDPSSSSSSSSSAFGFSILSRRRDQVHHSMDPASHESDLESFQRRVADRFHDLSSAGADDLLSVPWLRKLLEAFLACQDDFNDVVLRNRASFNKPPMDRHVAEFFDRSVKALDVCNAVRDGIDQIRQWQKQLEIVLCAFDGNRNIGEGQLRRAKKALVDLALGMLDEKDSSSHSHTPVGHRNRSFGCNSNSNSNLQKENKSLGHFRSLSWSVSRSWSASKQLQAINYNLVAPRANEITSTNGLNLAVFTMSYVLLFVMWALVAAIPCQDRGLQTHFLVMKQFQWAGPILSLHERILEESKRRDRRNACGLLREIQEIERTARNLNEMTDSVVQFPLGEEKEREVKESVAEVRDVYEAVKEGLDPLEKRVRDVFRRIVRSRAEGLDSVGRGE